MITDPTPWVSVLRGQAQYRHGRDFALRFGADGVTAAIWPLIVDGLLTMATVELWATARGARVVGGRWSVWLSFLFGVCLSLCANIAAAPELSVFAVAVAACPPLALLLAVELLNRALGRHRADTRSETDAQTSESEPPLLSTAASAPAMSPPSGVPTAERRMWAYYQAERADGRTPTGADLDRIAGTNNYGRRVLSRWRTDGWIGGGQTVASDSR
jgi:hypothetical protein